MDNFTLYYFSPVPFLLLYLKVVHIDEKLYGPKRKNRKSKQSEFKKSITTTMVCFEYDTKELRYHFTVPELFIS